MIESSIAGLKSSAGAIPDVSQEPQTDASSGVHSEDQRFSDLTDDLVVRFSGGLAEFSGKVFFILSGNDLTATEFVDATRRNRQLRHLMTRENVTQVLLSEVDHTFSRGSWRAEVEVLTARALFQMSRE